MKKIGLISALLFLSFAINAQTVKVKWKQIQFGDEGQVAIVGANGAGEWVTPPFLNIADTAAMLATYQAQINQRVRYTDTAAMLASIYTLINTKANDNAVVKLSGNQSIAGVKTFSASPIVPTPTANTQAANKKYVDDLAINIGDNYIPLSQKGANNGVATLGGDGKIPQGQLPSIAITNTYTAANQATMLALSATQGDVAVRTDLNKSFILSQEPATALANWQELLSPTVANTDQVPEGSNNLYFTEARARASISGGTGINYNATTGVITNSSPNLPSNLAVGTRTNTTLPITNSNGTGVTIPAATQTQLGGMTGTDKAKLDGIPADATNNTGTVTSITAGNGMANGTITTTGTIALGTPAAVTLSSANTVTATGHSHAFTPGGTANQYIRGNGTLATFPTIPTLPTQTGEKFTGATSLTLALSSAPSAAAHVFVKMNGIDLDPVDYTITGSNIVLAAAVDREADDVFLVYYSH